MLHRWDGKIGVGERGGEQSAWCRSGNARTAREISVDCLLPAVANSDGLASLTGQPAIYGVGDAFPLSTFHLVPPGCELGAQLGASTKRARHHDSRARGHHCSACAS